MAALSAASTQQVSLGNLKGLIFTFATISDGDTFASGLGTRVFGFGYQMTGNPVTQASAGTSIENSSGTFTFRPGENSLGGILTVSAIGG